MKLKLQTPFSHVFDIALNADQNKMSLFITFTRRSPVMQVLISCSIVLTITWFLQLLVFLFLLLFCVVVDVFDVLMLITDKYCWRLH